MNINPIVEQIFSNFEIDGKPIPIAFMQYFGSENQYLVYYTWYEKPDLFADNTNQTEVSSLTISVFSKENYKNIVEAVKTKMKENGFIWTDTASEDFDPETGFFHVPINFQAGLEILN